MGGNGLFGMEGLFQGIRIAFWGAFSFYARYRAFYVCFLREDYGIAYTGYEDTDLRL